MSEKNTNIPQGSDPYAPPQSSTNLDKRMLVMSPEGLRRQKLIWFCTGGLVISTITSLLLIAYLGSENQDKASELPAKDDEPAEVNSEQGARWTERVAKQAQAPRSL